MSDRSGRRGRPWVIPSGAAAVFAVALAVAWTPVSSTAQSRASAGARAPASVVERAEAGTREAEAQERVMGLTALARSALDRNRELRVAREGYVTAQEQVSEAWSNVMPSVDVSSSYTRNVDPTVNFLPAQIFDPSAGPDDYLAVQFGADNTWNSSINVEQPIFQPNVIVALGAAKRFESLQAEVVRGASQAAVTRLRTAYYDLLLAQEQARLTENSVRRVRESLRETKALNSAGLTSDYDVLRLEVELANLEPNLRRAVNAVAQARRQLAIQANVSEPETLEVGGTLAEMDLDDPGANSPANREILGFMGLELPPSDDIGAVLPDVVSRAAEMRSDVRQLELTEELRRTEMRAEQATYLPELSLFGSWTVAAQDNGSPNFFAIGDGQRAYSTLVGLRLTIPVFQGFSRDARIDQRRASVRQAQANTSQGLDVAESQVRTLVEAAQEARLRAQGQQLAVRQARRGFEIASAQYAEGLGSQLELTDAEVALRQSEFNYAQAVYDYLVARAQLDEAIGVVPLVDVEMRTVDTDA